jgi:hypothetical protein
MVLTLGACFPAEAERLVVRRRLRRSCRRWVVVTGAMDTSRRIVKNSVEVIVKSYILGFRVHPPKIQRSPLAVVVVVGPVGPSCGSRTRTVIVRKRRLQQPNSSPQPAP